MSPITDFLEGKIREEDLLLQVEHVLASGSAPDRTVLLVDWRTKSGLIRSLAARRMLDDKLRQYSGVLLDEMQRALADDAASGLHGIEPGRLIAGRFVLESKIGSGGMSEVYRCRDIRREEAQDRNPYIALKMLRPEVLAREDSIKILQREARKAQSLAHPNIVRIYDFDREGDILFITMELLSGSSLEDMIRANGLKGTSLAAIFPILNQIVSALQFAHQEGIVHSDLKPSNIIVQPNGRVKIIDFGISRARPDLHQQTADRTVFDVHALGAMTPAYASPEMIEGAPPDPRDDVFALACIIYELLTGQHPFGRTPASMARAGNFRPAKPPNLSQRQWDGLQAGLQFDRARRAASPEALLTGLMAPTSNMRFGRRAALSAGAVALVVVAGAAGLYFGNPRAFIFLVTPRPAPRAHVASWPTTATGDTAAELAKQKAAEDAARKLAEQKAADDEARKLAEQKVAEDAARKEAEQTAAELAARNQAEQQAAQDTARKLVEQKAAEDAARKEAEEVARKQAEQEAAQDAARKLAEQKAAEDAAPQQAERRAADEEVRKLADQKAAENAARKEAEHKVTEETARKQEERQAADAARKQAEVQVPQQIGPVQVEDAQTRLNALGLDVGRADGKPGPKTREMLRAFQFAARLPQTGELTWELVKSLHDASPSAIARGKALFQLAAGSEMDRRNSDAIRYYKLGLKLDPTNDAASRKLNQLIQEELQTRPVAQQSPVSSGTPAGAKVQNPEPRPDRDGSSQQTASLASPALSPSVHQGSMNPPKSKGPFDGTYWGVLKSTWLSGPNCGNFKRPVLISENKAYIQYRTRVLVAEVKPDGAFEMSEEIPDIQMMETISGKVAGNTLQAYIRNQLCRYRGTFTKEAPSGPATLTPTPPQP